LVDEPIAGQRRDPLERARLLEKVRGARNHSEIALAGHRGLGSSIHLQHHVITTADDQQRRCTDPGQRVARKIGPAPAGDDRNHVDAGIGRRGQRRARLVLAPK